MKAKLHPRHVQKRLLRAAVYVPSDQRSGSSRRPAPDCGSAPSEWTAEVCVSEVSQTHGDTVRKHHQAPLERLPQNKHTKIKENKIKITISSKDTSKKNFQHVTCDIGLFSCPSYD